MAILTLGGYHVPGTIGPGLRGVFDAQT